MSPELAGPERDIVVACLAGDEPGAYNIPVFLRFDEAVDIPRLVTAAEAVIGASPALRAAYTRRGRVVERTRAAVPARVERLRAHPGELYAVAASRRIEVLDPTLVRAAVVELDPPHPVHLFVNLHHAIADGMSLNLLLRAILDAYLTGDVTVLTGPASATADQTGRGPTGLVPATQLPATQVSATQVSATKVPAQAATLDPWAADPGSSGRFLAALAARRDPAAAPSVTERTIQGRGIRTFADSLAAFVPVFAGWLGVEEVVVSTALAGRSIRDLRTIGNFVRLQPLALPADGSTDYDDLARRLAIASAGPVPAPAPLDPRSRAAGVSVVFDYKRESLIARRVHPGIAAHVVADEGYRDVKYDLHISLYQCGATQQATVTARDIAPAAIADLLAAYADRLTAAPAPSAPVPSVPSGASRATASTIESAHEPEEALRACC